MTKVWFITGTSRGFGRVWAEAALERGDKVVATARGLNSLEALNEKYGENVLTLALDVNDKAAVDEAVRHAHDHFSHLDVIVNNAGYGQFGAVEEVSEQEARDQIETNLFGALWVTQAVLPYLREQGSGHIVQISSIGGVNAFPNVALYHASKWGLEGFSQALSQEVQPFGIKVTLVEPIGYDTDWSGPSAKTAKQLPAYEHLREAATSRRGSSTRGNPEATGPVMLKLVDMEDPPLRIFFGKSANEMIHGEYEKRLAEWDKFIEIQAAQNEAFNSSVQHLVVRYSPDASPSLPSALLLKRNVNTDWGREAGRSEVAFYQLATQHMQHLPMIIPHFAAIYDEQTGDSLLLLQDLSETHRVPVTRGQQIGLQDIPTDTVLHEIVETLAAFHAAWWEHPLLGTYPIETDDDFQDKEHFRDYCLYIDQNWQSCLAAEGDWLPKDVVHDINEIVRSLPGAWERYLSVRFPTHHQITFLHTDAYLANFLVPRKDGMGTVYMMDWQLPNIGIGAFDLVIMCASFWTPAQRHENKREETMLRRYLAALSAHGVKNYRWDQLLEDYRLMIMFFLQVAIWDQTNGSERSYWWPKLQCLLSAARDHDSLGLLL